MSVAFDVLVDGQAVFVLSLASSVGIAVPLSEAAGLAALGVDRLALIVLCLAGVGAGVGALRSRVRGALVAVLVCVQLEDVAGVPVVLDVVARDDG